MNTSDITRVRDGRGGGALPTAFPTDPHGLPEAVRPEPIELADDAVLDLRVGAVAKRLGTATVRMLAYNGSIPGPTLKVRQGSELVVNVTNDGDLETTVHWHGLRLENRYDGVPYETQAPIPVGGGYTYRLRFPDPGLYWYHPHVREDYAQELGLYGNILVVPADADYWPPADRDAVLTLDDVLLEDGRIAAFSPDQTTHAAMGRFGNLLLIGGETAPALTATAGEVVRLWLTNTTNARVFNVVLPGARMKLIGGDSGRMEHEQFVSEVLLSPSERAVVDVLVDQPGRLTLEHRTPDRVYPLASLTVRPPATPSGRPDFDRLRDAPELIAERERLDAWLAAPPDKILALVAEMDDPAGAPGDGPIRYGCPMHPEVTSDDPGRCPKCGMKLLAVQPTADAAVQPTADAAGHEMGHADNTMHGVAAARQGHEAVPTDRGGHGHDGGGVHEAGGIEWEDDMAAVNRQTTPANTRWQFHDRTGGGDATEFDWRFTVGDRVKIRLLNEMDSDHPMHHTFHLHGAGRFLVLARNGVTEPNLVWKDSVLLRTGQTVDILFDVTGPGRWMAHCHIPEHMHSGMMFSFTVSRSPGPGR